MKKSLTNMSENVCSIGTGLFSIPVLVLLLTSVTFALGGFINPFIFPFSVLCGAGIVIYSSKRLAASAWGNVLLYFSVVLLSLLVANNTLDYSWDGLAYHQDIISQLKEGWNPIYSHHAPGANADLAIWVDHYAKGLETMAATVYSFTDEIESGKAINFLLIVASYCFVYYFLCENRAELTLVKRVFYSLLFTFSPVVIVQCFTYYIDWSMYSLLLIFVSVLFLKKGEVNVWQLLCLSGVLFLSFSIKFNIAFWVCYAMACGIIYYLYDKKYSIVYSLLFISVIASLASIALPGYNPYITNIMDHSNPFYPLMGEGSVNIEMNQTPQNMQTGPAIKNIFLSLFSHAGAGPSGSANLMFPFAFTVDDVRRIGHTDIRTSGFGVLFSGLLLLCSYLYARCKMEKRDRILSLIILLVLFSGLFILPMGWWARYVPYFYAFPLIMLLYTERGSLSNRCTLLRKFIYVCFLLNIGITFGSTLKFKILSYSTQLEQVMEQIATTGNPSIYLGTNVGLKIKLQQYGISYIEQKDTTGLNVNLYLTPPVFMGSVQKPDAAKPNDWHPKPND